MKRNKRPLLVWLFAVALIVCGSICFTGINNVPAVADSGLAINFNCKDVEFVTLQETFPPDPISPVYSGSFEVSIQETLSSDSCERIIWSLSPENNNYGCSIIPSQAPDEYTTAGLSATLLISQPGIYNLSAYAHYVEYDQYESSTVEYVLQDTVKIVAVLPNTATYTVSTSSLTFYMDDIETQSVYFKKVLAGIPTDLTIDDPFYPSISLLEGGNSVVEFHLKEMAEGMYFYDRMEISPLSVGKTTMTVMYYNYSQGGEESSAYTTIGEIEITVLEKREDAPPIPTLSFEEGNSAKAFKDDGNQTLTLAGISDATGATVTWSTLDENVAKLVKVSDTQVKIRPISPGKTIATVAYTNANGATTYGFCEIEILKDVPIIKINIAKTTETDNTAFSIYDTLKVELGQSYNFAYSENASFVWTLDGAPIIACLDSNGGEATLSSSSQNFFFKFSYGKHALGLTVTDPEYGLTLTASREIQVYRDSDITRVLSVNSDADKIFLALEGGTGTLTALIDGVINTDYEYFWDIDNDKIALVSVFTDNSSSVLLMPKAVGETELFVFVDVGTYSTKILRYSVSVVVEKIESIAIVGENDFYKPGENGRFNILVNGKKGFINLAPVVTATLDGEELNSFTVNSDRINIENMSAGILSLSATVSSFNATSSTNITNINFEKLLRDLFPYLLVLLLIVIVIAIILKKKKTVIDSLLAKTAQIDKSCEKLVNAIDGETPISITRARAKFGAIHAKIMNLMSQGEYALDKNFDELTLVVTSIKTLHKISEATLVTTTQATQLSKLKQILKHMRVKNLAPINANLLECRESRIKFEKNAQAIEKREMIREKREKKGRITKEDYAEYLKDLQYYNSAGEADPSEDHVKDGEDNDENGDGAGEN